MSDIFVSYSKKDAIRIRPFISALRRRRLDVWLDENLQAGDEWDAGIDEKIQAAKCMIVLWSRNSVRSRWVRTEAHEGLTRRILIPVFIDKVRPPLAFRLIQTMDLVDWGESRNKSAL